MPACLIPPFGRIRGAGHLRSRVAGLVPSSETGAKVGSIKLIVPP